MKNRLQTIVLPRICSSSSCKAAEEKIGAALAAEQLVQPAAEGAAAWQPTTAAAALSRSRAATK